MGFYKFREWVETVTGKGDRWGRNRVGRSEPAFLSDSTFALPPLTCTARREAGQRRLRLLFCCEAGQLLAVCFVEACAGRRVRRLCPPAVACSAGYVCLLAFAMPCPLPFSTFLPPFSCFALPPCSFHGRQDQQFASCKNCPVGSCNTGLQWRPVRRFIVDFTFFLQNP